MSITQNMTQSMTKNMTQSMTKNMTPIEKNLAVLRLLSSGATHLEILKQGYSYRNIYSVKRDLKRRNGDKQDLAKHYVDRLQSGYTQY